ncbi:M20 family metallopeptidase [Salinicoccus sp. HZC-1]|uniref:M20 family metallopeptidase n=1 Tax=Salinicoccus sp. HZC-1 TaxID=3385497 RepID=UPI00398BA7AD
MILGKLMDRLKDKEERMVEIRRHLHENPELSFQETETAKYIAEFYEEKDVEVETGVGGNGVKVTIDTGTPGKTLALRADFDALPILEETDLPFASKNEGVMHACGHDAHTAYMLILAETLIELKDELKGTIVIIHQHAEELPPGGAQRMIADGILDGVDNVLGAHVMSNMETGKVLYREKESMTGRGFFKLTIKGSGGHGSSPHLANDPIVAGAHFVSEVQTIVSRRLNPFEAGVVTIGSFDGKGVFNVIKDQVVLEGDVRAMGDDTKKTIEKEIKRISSGIEATFGVTNVLEYKDDYPTLYNDPELTRQVAKAIKDANLSNVTSVERCEPQPPSEDFAYYTKELPSSFIYIGAAPEGQIYPHHHPKFDINEDSLLIAAQSIGSAAIDYLMNDSKE